MSNPYATRVAATTGPTRPASCYSDPPAIPSWQNHDRDCEECCGRPGDSNGACRCMACTLCVAAVIIGFVLLSVLVLSR
jgi:hypothetical protein